MTEAEKRLICDVLSGLAALHEQTPYHPCADPFSEATCPFDIVHARKVATVGATNARALPCSCGRSFNPGNLAQHVRATGHKEVRPDVQ